MSLEDQVTLSPRAASMGGSQAFLDAGERYKLSELLKTVIVASANDSAVALAEHLAGTEESFVRLMNTRAEELGLTNTHYANCTGLPAGPISNPGLAAIQAALAPQCDEEVRDCYFFVTDLSGHYYYAKTYAEHQANCRKAAEVNQSLKK